MKGYYFGPITEDKVIKFANVNFYAPTVVDLISAVGNSSPIDRVTSQPGLTANGQPTSNIALTIPYQDIEANNNWGYIDIVYGDLGFGDGTGGAPASSTVTQVYSFAGSGAGLSSGQFGFNGDATSFFQSKFDSSGNDISQTIGNQVPGWIINISGAGVTLVGAITTDYVDVGDGYLTWGFSLTGLIGTLEISQAYSIEIIPG